MRVFVHEKLKTGLILKWVSGKAVEHQWRSQDSGISGGTFTFSEWKSLDKQRKVNRAQYFELSHLLFDHTTPTPKFLNGFTQIPRTVPARTGGLAPVPPVTTPLAKSEIPAIEI